MKMALPRGMIRHPKTGVMQLRKVIPPELRSYFGGKREIKKTLETKDAKEAEVLFHLYSTEVANNIARARKLLAGEPDPGTFTVVLTPERQAQVEAFQSATSEGRMARMVDKVDRTLEQAGLVHPVENAIKFSAMFEKWKTEKKPTSNTLLEFERSKRDFVKLNGDLLITEYNVVHARKWKDFVLGLSGPKGRTLAQGTLIKVFSAVRTVFRYADRNEYLNVNPFEKIGLEKTSKGHAKKRLEWDEDELKVLFSSPVYSKGERPRGGAGEASYWLPVLGLYHGARLGELCQLDKADVVKRSGIWCFKITDSEGEDGKSIKTDTSDRYVPIHKRVIELGFLRYLASVTSKKLFPLIKPDKKGRWAGNISKWFGRYRKDIGLGDRFRDFHSLRHGWKSAARGAGIPEEHHDEITGHENGAVGRGYGSVPIVILKKEIDKIKFSIKIPEWQGA
jgi:integrase